ncbi:MAG TPA: FecR domain-containing protein [Burkholderiales bacterium]|nr:FecR domain-containing protein [Burkholderiales bacterium]
MRLYIGSALVAVTLAASGVAAAQSGARSRAAPPATVESLQLSASVERGRQIVPLTPGFALREGDRVNTGARSRLILKLADGSTIKLGERGSLFFDRAQVREDGIFDAALFVAEGAFRFTTAALDRLRGKREVSIAVNNVTAGIRGTDLWGKSTPESDIVCLIEGSVEVTPPGEKPFTLDQPLSFYALEGNVSKPVATVLADKFKEWAAETEQEPGNGVASRRGRWKISIASIKKSGEALDAYDALRKAGYAAEIVPAKAGDERTYSVRLSGFESEKDAKSAVEALKGEPNVAKYDYRVGM